VHSIDTQRTRLLVQIEKMLERPMIVLAAIWLILVVVELTHGITPAGEVAGLMIWAAFVADFLLKTAIAPRKFVFLRRNWIALLSLVLPPFRLLRISRAFRAVRVLRGLRFARLLGSLNRGMRALRRSMRRHGFGYIVTLTLVVLFAGAAGMMSFEREGPNRPAFESYTTSLWWTAMLMTSLGSEVWPRTGGGRALTLVLALYSFGVFGYITATLASFFIEQGDEARPRQS
jgi:voltage-gated potassium channel